MSLMEISSARKTQSDLSDTKRNPENDSEIKVIMDSDNFKQLGQIAGTGECRSSL